ncbi:MAG TPA: hypothetical protein VFQ44_25815, partial [Streptosporangiaceae bacterium]|nr:hypothetical protein [Streptosporangiaceae bacterium]
MAGRIAARPCRPPLTRSRDPLSSAAGQAASAACGNGPAGPPAATARPGRPRQRRAPRCCSRRLADSSAGATLPPWQQERGDVAVAGGVPAAAQARRCRRAAAA